MSNAIKVVNTLLEADDERVRKWDKAHQTYRELYKKHVQARDLFHQLGRSISYERALARAGVNKEDVERPLTGDQIGATHNYKQTRPVKVCQNTYCGAGRRPQTGEACRECGEPLTTVQMPYSPSDLRSKMAKHIVGVLLKDGRYVWFNEPLPDNPTIEFGGD